jgi:hypothetical protein
MLRAVVVMAVLILVIRAALVVAPPFPAATTLIREPLRELATELGPPEEMTENVPAHLPASKSWVWSRSRVIAYWTVEADLPHGTVGDSSHPISVLRCLRLKWVPEWVGVMLFLPCDAVMEAHIVASNFRWSGP